MKINHACQEGQLENKLSNYYRAKRHAVQSGGQQRPDETPATYSLTLEEHSLAKHFSFTFRSIENNESDEWLHLIRAGVRWTARISVGFHPAAPGPASPLGQSRLLSCSATSWECGPVFWVGFAVILHATVDECLSCHPASCFGSSDSSHQHVCGKYFSKQSTPASNKGYYSCRCAITDLWLGFGQVLRSALSTRLEVFWCARGQWKHIVSAFSSG